MTIQATLAACCLVWREGRVLLLWRAGSDWRNGEWAFPAGKIEAGEEPRSCARRELFEETVILVPEDALGLHCVVWRPENAGLWLDFVFAVHVDATVNAEIGESDKATEIDWFDPLTLPSDVVPIVPAALGRPDAMLSTIRPAAGSLSPEE